MKTLASEPILWGRIRLGPPQTVGAGLRIFPLLDPEPPAEPPAYDLLADALAAGRAAVEEHRDGPRVGELVVHVRGPRPVLIPDGEILKGGLQTRTVNITLLLGEGTHPIPVSCVERGRWGGRQAFRPERFLADVELRRQKARTAVERLRRGEMPRPDQGRVWGHVHLLLDDAAVDSPTEDLTDLWEARGSALEADLRSVVPQPGQVGVLAEKDGRVLGLDVFEHPAVWTRLAEKVLGGYGIAARWTKAAEDAPMDADAFLEALRTASAETVPVPVGLGEHRLFLGKVTGFALVHEGRTVHLFAAPAGRS
jgi:hypothetical protein